MSRLRPVYLVAERELRERLSSRAFQVSTAFTVLLVVGLLLAPTLFGSGDPAEYEIGVTGTEPEDLAAFLETGATEEGTTAESISYPTEEALRGALLDGEVEIGIVDRTEVLTSPDTGGELLTLVTAALTAEGSIETAAELGVTPEALEEILASGPAIEELTADDDTEDRLVIAFLGTVLLFVSIVSYGQWILIGVVEEKSSRVVEVVLGAIRPRQLLAGKVLGIGALGLLQLLLISAIGLFGIHNLGDLDVPAIGPELIAIVVGWFLLGFAFYASGYAVAGALVSRQEDAQNASLPLTIVIVAGYFVSATALGAGDNTVLRVMSVIPPFSPLTMPLRQAIGAAAAWEVVVSVALMLFAIAVMLRIGGRVYAGGLLRTGARVKVREALRTAER